MALTARWTVAAGAEVEVGDGLRGHLGDERHGAFDADADVVAPDVEVGHLAPEHVARDAVGRGAVDRRPPAGGR